MRLVNGIRGHRHIRLEGLNLQEHSIVLIVVAVFRDAPLVSVTGRPWRL